MAWLVADEKSTDGKGQTRAPKTIGTGFVLVQLPTGYHTAVTSRAMGYKRGLRATTN